MLEVRCYLPKELLDDITSKCQKLNISKSEYLRLLASLDTSNDTREKLLKYLNYLDNSMVEMAKKLGFVSLNEEFM